MTKRPRFKPAWWLNNAHLQTMWSEVMRERTKIPLEHERFELSCGDFVDLTWSQTGFKDTVLMLHGLGGSVDSPYMRGMLNAFNQRHFNTLAMHFRNCSKEPNRHFQMFHGGQTCDLAEVITELKTRMPDNRIFAIGFSIGGNILLKYLGEQGENAPLSGAAAISIPFSLAKTQEILSQGFARVYQRYLLNKLVFATIKKLIVREHDGIDLLSVAMAKDLREFDELVTVPMHGFDSASDYYAKSSSLTYLKGIKVPTLIVHAKDDPFLPASAIPKAKHLSDSIELLITKHGGHVGFISGTSPKNPVYWLERVVPDYFIKLLSER